MTYDRWKTRSPDDDFSTDDEPSREQQRADYEDEMQQKNECQTYKRTLKMSAEAEALYRKMREDEAKLQAAADFSDTDRTAAK